MANKHSRFLNNHDHSDNVTAVSRFVPPLVFAALTAFSWEGDQSLPSSVAFATSQSLKRQVSYPIEQVWPATVRYLRVDREFEIEDLDRSNGYILFRIPAGEGRTSRGSLEFIENTDAAGRDAVTLRVTATQGPPNFAFTLLDGIERKLKDERGQPVPPPSPSLPPE